MKRIGLTGNIGTGKTTVARVFETLGVPVYHADKQARTFLDTSRVKEKLTTLFGRQVLDADQNVNRKALAAIVFNDKSKLDLLNGLIHPLVEQDFNIWCTLQQGNPYILHEAAILFESGFNRLFEANILVTAPIEVCIARVTARDGISEQLVMERMQNQWTQERKLEMADYIVLNDEQSMIIPQILHIHHAILER
ncbi:MAG: dephospho-CoA kinase [Bacteroidota bacterium]